MIVDNTLFMCNNRIMGTNIRSTVKVSTYKHGDVEVNLVKTGGRYYVKHLTEVDEYGNPLTLGWVERQTSRGGRWCGVVADNALREGHSFMGTVVDEGARTRTEVLEEIINVILIRGRSYLITDHIR